MGYFFVMMAVVCFTLQFLFTKAYEQRVNQTITTSFIMLTFASALGVALYLIICSFEVRVSLTSIILATVYALIMIPYYVISVKILSLGSVTIYSMFMMLGGMILPFLYGVTFLKESLSLPKIIGCVLLACFIVLQAIGQKKSLVEKEKRNRHVLLFVLLLCIFVINGMTGVIAAVHQNQADAVDEISFTVLSCAFTVLISVTVLAIQFAVNKKQKILSETCEFFKPATILLSLLIGAVMYTGNFLILIAANRVPASVQFPIISGGTIVLSTLASVIIYKEKIGILELIAVIGAFISTFLFAI